MNSREQLVNTVVHTVSSCMQTEIDSEEDPLFHELPLNTLITWTRWWHLTAKTLTLVLKKKIFGVVGPHLRGERTRVDNRSVELESRLVRKRQRTEQA